jgi:aldehyde dehydrogenase (NAD+)
MTMALDFDPRDVRVPTSHMIGGRPVGGLGDAFPVRRPSDLQILAAIEDGGDEAVARAVEAAKTGLAASRWAGISPRERARVLFRWAELIEQDVAGLARLESVNSTRPIAETMVRDVPRTAGVIRYYAEFCDKTEGSITATESGIVSLVHREPYGIVGAIVPWNFPMITAAWKFAPALAAGNAVVMKTSEFTPFSLIRLAELAGEAGLPGGLFNVVNGLGPSTGMAIVRHPDIAKITFTGSTATGARIMSEAALAGIKPVTLELGGKSPQLVFGDCGDIDRTADFIARGFVGNAGQVCTAGSRLVVHHSIADELLARVIARADAFVAGPTWRAASTLSPILNERQFERIDGLVRETVAQGATVLTGGGRLPVPNEGCYYAPTILDGVSPQMPGHLQEFFGPVLTVSRFDEAEEGLAQCAHPTYGLAASVYTRDINKALRAAKQIEAGMIWVNHHGRAPEFTFPAGGFKSSGFGKDMGRSGIESFLREKAIWIDHGQD